MNVLLDEITNRYNSLVREAKMFPYREIVDQSNHLLKEIIDTAKTVYNPEQRNILSSMARSLGEVIYSATGEYPSVSILPYQEIGPSISFLDRENEIASILSTFAPSYTLIDAPAGYGKTSLLLELNQRFNNMNWLCTYFPIPQPITPENFITIIAEKLEIEILQNENLPFLYRLIGSLGNRWTKEQKEGMVILIDFKESQKDLVEFLTREFIPQLETSLRSLRFFAEQPNRLKVIIAGRSISSVLSMLQKYTFRTIQLTPFNYELIQEAVSRTLTNLSAESINQFAAHLTHLTGGHPRSVAILLNQYLSRGFAPDLFIKYESEGVIDMILKTTNDILDDIPEKMKRMLLTLSVFRFIDHSLLRSLFFAGQIESEFHDEYYLMDMLTSRNLCVRKGRLLYNSSIRRLLALNLMYNNNDLFRKLSSMAKEQVFERLRLEYIQEPELWVIEYLFQELQFSTSQIQENSRRHPIRKEFFGYALPQALISLIKRVPESEKEIEKLALIDAMDRDWEFVFTVNYYLRDNSYNNEPFAELKNQVNRFFNDHNSTDF